MATRTSTYYNRLIGPRTSMHPLISPPSPPIIHHYHINPSVARAANKQRSARPWIMCVPIYIHIACRQSLRTFMKPCPYAFVGTEMTTRRPPLAHAPTISGRAAPVVHKRSTIEMVGQHTRMSLPCHRACQILIFFSYSYHKRPYKLNLFFCGPELATPRRTRVSCHRLAWNFYRFRLPAYRHSWNTWLDCPRRLS
jgi:hypothetical protein